MSKSEIYSQSKKDSNLKYCNFLLERDVYELILCSKNPAIYNMKEVLMDVMWSLYNLVKIENKNYQIQLMGSKSIVFTTEFSYNVVELFKSIDKYISSLPVNTCYLDYKSNFKELDIVALRFYIKE